jgi:hypothetical protein
MINFSVNLTVKLAIFNRIFGKKYLTYEKINSNYCVQPF